MGKVNHNYQEDLDRYANEYLLPDNTRTVDQRIIGILADRIIPRLKGPDVLEMGYGDGVWSGRLIEQFGKTFVVDASHQLLEVAKSTWGSRIETFESYFEEFDSLRKFDSIICTYVLEHVVDPVQVLKKCRDWLKADGTLVVAVPSATSLNRRMGLRMGLQKDLSELTEQDVKMGHRRVFDGPTLESNLHEAGYVILENLTMMCKPLPNSMLSHLNDAQLAGLFDLGDELPYDQRAILVYQCGRSE